MRGCQRRQVAELPHHGVMQRLGAAREDDQAGHRRSRRHSRRRGAALAVPGHEDPRRVDGRVTAQQPDRGDGLRHVLIGQREVRVSGDQVRVGAGHLLEPQHGDARGGQSPGEVLERLVPPDCLVLVIRPRAGQQDHAGDRYLAGAARDAQRSRYGQRPVADRDVMLGERVRVRVRRRVPGGDRCGGAGRQQLDADDPGSLVSPAFLACLAFLADQADGHGRGRALERHRDLHQHGARAGGLRERRAQRGQLAVFRHLRVPGRPQCIRRRQRAELRQEPVAYAGELSAPGHLDDGQRRVRECHTSLLVSTTAAANRTAAGQAIRTSSDSHGESSAPGGCAATSA